MKTKYILPLLALSLIAFSCGNEENQVIADKASVSVKINAVNDNDNNSFITASGTIQAVKSANLTTRMMGYVAHTPVNVGDKVKQGQLLVAIV